MIEDQILKLVEEANPANPIDYVQNIVKPLAINKLDQYILECNDCDICNCTKTLTYGNPNASIVILGESCSEDQQCDNQHDLPFNNAAGDILKKVLTKLNVNEDELFFINSVNCFPHRKNNEDIKKRAPTVKERKNCKVFVDYALNTVKPLLIICLGSVATNDINEEIGKQAISKIRGQYFLYRGIDVLPTYHPGYFIELEKSNFYEEDYLNTLRWDFYTDLETAFNNFNNKYPDINIFNKGD